MTEFNLLGTETEYSKKEYVFDLVLGIIALILVAFLFFASNFWISTVCVKQTSMTNTLQDGDVLILDRLAKVERGDVVVFKQNDKEDYIKRVIAVEGDTIYTKNGEVWLEYLDGGKISIGKLNEPYIKNPKAGTYLYYYADRKVEIPRLTVGKGQYFVLGDNRENSTDSRTYFNLIDGTINENTTSDKYVGLVDDEQIIGVVHQFWIENKEYTTKIFA